MSDLLLRARRRAFPVRQARYPLLSPHRTTSLHFARGRGSHLSEPQQLPLGVVWPPLRTILEPERRRSARSSDNSDWAAGSHPSERTAGHGKESRAEKSGAPASEGKEASSESATTTQFAKARPGPRVASSLSLPAHAPCRPLQIRGVIGSTAFRRGCELGSVPPYRSHVPGPPQRPSRTTYCTP